MGERNMSIVFSSGVRNLVERNSSFDSGVLRVAYTGKNRNNSFISKETFERCMPSIYNCPIVCNYDRESDTIGSHDMELEMKYFRDVLCPREESGEVVRFELQKKYELQPKFTHDGKTVLPITYVADFYIEYADGHTEVIDTKGCPDSVAKIKRKLFWHTYPDVRYRWITYVKKWGGWLDYETVQTLRKEQKRSKNKKEDTDNG